MTYHETTWLPVPGYEKDYLISPTGIIKSLHANYKGFILGQRRDRGGYYTVKLAKRSNKSRQSTQYVHRLLAMTYIDNPDSKKYVNHKNGNKLDNNLDNLEWVTFSENMKHAKRLGLSTHHKKPVIDRCTGKVYESMRAVATERKIHYATIKSYLHGRTTNRTCLEFLKPAA